MNRVAEYIDNINLKIGETVKWLSTVLLIVICVDVVMRYTLDNSKVWVLELEWHIFSLLFLLGSAFTLLKDEHVRVDVFHTNWPKKKKARAELFYTLFLLIPWCLIIIYYGFQYGQNSFSYNESSPNPGGLPARYLIKFSIVIGFFLLFMQAISKIIKQISILKN